MVIINYLKQSTRTYLLYLTQSVISENVFNSGQPLNNWSSQKYQGLSNWPSALNWHCHEHMIKYGIFPSLALIFLLLPTTFVSKCGPVDYSPIRNIQFEHGRTHSFWAWEFWTLFSVILWIFYSSLFVDYWTEMPKGHQKEGVTSISLGNLLHP